MPHDANGVLLEKGDTVTLKAKVVEVYPQSDACNVQLTIEKNEPHEVEGFITLNSRQVVKESS